MPSSLGPAELLVIAVFALIVLGPKRLPEAGRQVGRALAEVRKWSQGISDEMKSAIDLNPTDLAGNGPGPAVTRTPTPLATPPPVGIEALAELETPPGVEAGGADTEPTTS